MTICGDDRVFIPDLEPCDECASFQEQLTALVNTVDGKQDTLTPGGGITIDGSTIALDIDSIPDMQGATAGNAGRHGLVPEPQMGDLDKVLHGDGSWRTVQQSLTAGDGIEISNNTISALRSPTNTYTKAEVDALIADVEHVHLVEVDVLPATGEGNIIYLVPRSSGTGKEMWIYSNDVWHDLGPTTIDLSSYYTKTETDGLLNGKVDKVSGMGLSQKSYTTAEKNKLSALPTAASLNTSLSNKQDKLTFDNVPTDGSNNPVKSDGVYDRFVKSDLNLAPIYDTTLTVPIPKGGYLNIDGVLHKATQDLAPGDTPVVGGNVERSVEFANQARAAVISTSISCQHMGLSVSPIIIYDAEGFSRLHTLILQELSNRRQGDDTRQVFVHGILINSGSIEVFEALCGNLYYARIDIMRYVNTDTVDKNAYTGILYDGVWTVYKRYTLTPV